MAEYGVRYRPEVDGPWRARMGDIVCHHRSFGVGGVLELFRVRDIAQASTIELTRKEWYALYLASGNTLP